MEGDIHEVIAPRGLVALHGVRGPESRQSPLQDVVRYVARHFDHRIRILPAQPDRHPLAWGEEEVGDRVHQSPVDLFGHKAVRRAQSGLDVRDRHANLRGRERAGEGRVGVADHDRDARPVLLEPPLARDEDRGGLSRVSARSHVQKGVRRAHAELIVVDLVQLVVVVLAGIDGGDGADGGQRVAQHAGFDHLRTRTEEEGDRRGRY